MLTVTIPFGFSARTSLVVKNTRQPFNASFLYWCIWTKTASVVKRSNLGTPSPRIAEVHGLIPCMVNFVNDFPLYTMSMYVLGWAPDVSLVVSRIWRNNILGIYVCVVVCRLLLFPVFFLFQVGLAYFIIISSYIFSFIAAHIVNNSYVIIIISCCSSFHPIGWNDEQLLFIIVTGF